MDRLTSVRSMFWWLGGNWSMLTLFVLFSEVVYSIEVYHRISCHMGGTVDGFSDYS